MTPHATNPRRTTQQEFKSRQMLAHIPRTNIPRTTTTPLADLSLNTSGSISTPRFWRQQLKEFKDQPPPSPKKLKFLTHKISNPRYKNPTLEMFLMASDHAFCAARTSASDTFIRGFVANGLRGQGVLQGFRRMTWGILGVHDHAFWAAVTPAVDAWHRHRYIEGLQRRIGEAASG